MGTQRTSRAETPPPPAPPRHEDTPLPAAGDYARHPAPNSAEEPYDLTRQDLTSPHSEAQPRGRRPTMSTQSACEVASNISFAQDNYHEARFDLATKIAAEAAKQDSDAAVGRAPVTLAFPSGHSRPAQDKWAQNIRKLLGATEPSTLGYFVQCASSRLDAPDGRKCSTAHFAAAATNTAYTAVVLDGPSTRAALNEHAPHLSLLVLLDGKGPGAIRYPADDWVPVQADRPITAGTPQDVTMPFMADTLQATSETVIKTVISLPSQAGGTGNMFYFTRAVRKHNLKNTAKYLAIGQAIAQKDPRGISATGKLQNSTLSLTKKFGAGPASFEITRLRKQGGFNHFTKQLNKALGRSWTDNRPPPPLQFVLIDPTDAWDAPGVDYKDNYAAACYSDSAAGRNTMVVGIVLIPAGELKDQATGNSTVGPALVLILQTMTTEWMLGGYLRHLEKSSGAAAAALPTYPKDESVPFMPDDLTTNQSSGRDMMVTTVTRPPTSPSLDAAMGASADYAIEMNVVAVTRAKIRPYEMQEVQLVFKHDPDIGLETGDIWTTGVIALPLGPTMQNLVSTEPRESRDRRMRTFLRQDVAANHLHAEIDLVNPGTQLPYTSGAPATPPPDKILERATLHFPSHHDIPSPAVTITQGGGVVERLENLQKQKLIDTLEGAEVLIHHVHTHQQSSIALVRLEPLGPTAPAILDGAIVQLNADFVIHGARLSEQESVKLETMLSKGIANDRKQGLRPHMVQFNYTERHHQFTRNLRHNKIQAAQRRRIPSHSAEDVAELIVAWSPQFIARHHHAPRSLSINLAADSGVCYKNSTARTTVFVSLGPTQVFKLCEAQSSPKPRPPTPNPPITAQPTTPLVVQATEVPSFVQQAQSASQSSSLNLQSDERLDSELGSETLPLQGAQAEQGLFATMNQDIQHGTPPRYGTRHEAPPGHTGASVNREVLVSNKQPSDPALTSAWLALRSRVRARIEAKTRAKAAKAGQQRVKPLNLLLQTDQEGHSTLQTPPAEYASSLALAGATRAQNPQTAVPEDCEYKISQYTRSEWSADQPSFASLGPGLRYSNYQGLIERQRWIELHHKFGHTSRPSARQVYSALCVATSEAWKTDTTHNVSSILVTHTAPDKHENRKQASGRRAFTPLSESDFKSITCELVQDEEEIKGAAQKAERIMQEAAFTTDFRRMCRATTALEKAASLHAPLVQVIRREAAPYVLSGWRADVRTTTLLNAADANLNLVLTTTLGPTWTICGAAKPAKPKPQTKNKDDAPTRSDTLTLFHNGRQVHIQAPKAVCIPLAGNETASGTMHRWDNEVRTWLQKEARDDGTPPLYCPWVLIRNEKQPRAPAWSKENMIGPSSPRTTRAVAEGKRRKVTEREATVKANLNEERRSRLADVMIAAGAHDTQYQLALAVGLRTASVQAALASTRRHRNVGAAFPETTLEERVINSHLPMEQRVIFRTFMEAAYQEKMDYERAVDIACTLTNIDRHDVQDGLLHPPPPQGRHRINFPTSSGPTNITETSPPVSPVATQLQVEEQEAQTALKQTVRTRSRVLQEVKTHAYNTRLSAAQRPAAEQGDAPSISSSFAPSSMDSAEWNRTMAAHSELLPDLGDMGEPSDVALETAKIHQQSAAPEPDPDRFKVSAAKVSDNSQAFAHWARDQPPHAASQGHFERGCVSVRPKKETLLSWRTQARPTRQPTCLCPEWQDKWKIEGASAASGGYWHDRPTAKAKATTPPHTETTQLVKGTPTAPRKGTRSTGETKHANKKPRNDPAPAAKLSWPHGKGAKGSRLLHQVRSGTLPLRFFCKERVDTQPYIGGQTKAKGTLHTWTTNSKFDNMMKLAANAVVSSQARISPRTTSIEAPPGTGKSSLIRYLEAHNECGFKHTAYLEEPLDKFEHVFKELDAGRMSALQVQKTILSTQAPYTDGLVVTDRGTGISSLPFILMNFFAGTCTEDQATEQLQLLARAAGAPASMLYLCMPAQDALANIKTRKGQAGDEWITETYCTQIAAAHALSMALMCVFADRTLVRCIAAQKHTPATAQATMQPLMANVAALVAETNNQAARSGVVDDNSLNNAKDVAVARHQAGGNLHDSMRLVHVVMQGEETIPVFLPVRDGESPATLALRMARIAEQATNGRIWPHSPSEYVVIETCTSDGMPPRPSQISSGMRASDDGYMYDAFTAGNLHSGQPEPDSSLSPPLSHNADQPRSSRPPQPAELDQGVPSMATQGMAAHHATAELNLPTAQAQAAQQLRNRLDAQNVTAAQLMEELRKNPALVQASGANELDLDTHGMPLHPSIPRPCQPIKGVMLCEHFARSISATDRLLRGDTEEDTAATSLAPVRTLAEYVEASDRLDTWATATGKFTPLESADHRGYTREIRRLCSIYDFKCVIQYDHLYRELKHIGEIANWHTNRPELHLRVLLPGLKQRGAAPRGREGKNNRSMARAGTAHQGQRQRGRNNSNGQRPSPSTELCRNFALGRCRNGSTCRFKHNKPPKTANSNNIQRPLKK